MSATASGFDEFTEAGFRALLRSLNERNYRFAGYGDVSGDRHVIWRHDVDASMHRAAALARIEAEHGTKAVYFLNPHCEFYNLLEPAITALALDIARLGHDIGLHFDAGAHGVDRWDKAALDRALAREKALLESVIEAPVKSVSWHNPDLSNLLEFDADEIDGMANAYGRRMRADYVYCSDSNGYWRFKPMQEVIAEGHDRLHLLTHPEWWTPESLSPSERIDRAIAGRARSVRAGYDDVLKRGGRTNIK